MVWPKRLQLATLDKKAERVVLVYEEIAWLELKQLLEDGLELQSLFPLPEGTGFAPFNHAVRIVVAPHDRPQLANQEAIAELVP